MRFFADEQSRFKLELTPHILQMNAVCGCQIPFNKDKLKQHMASKKISKHTAGF